MLARQVHAPRRLISRIIQNRPIERQRNVVGNYSIAMKSARSTEAGSDPAPTAEDLRKLRAKEHRLRKSFFGGLIVATILGYYLDGKYNARAIRRTLRTAWVGALLAADYKWNFTLITCTAPC